LYEGQERTKFPAISNKVFNVPFRFQTQVIFRVNNNVLVFPGSRTDLSRPLRQWLLDQGLNSFAEVQSRVQATPLNRNLEKFGVRRNAQRTGLNRASAALLRLSELFWGHFYRLK